MSSEVKERQLTVPGKEFAYCFFEILPRHYVTRTSADDQLTAEIDRTIGIAVKHCLDCMRIIDAPAKLRELVVVITLVQISHKRGRVDLVRFG